MIVLEVTREYMISTNSTVNTYKFSNGDSFVDIVEGRDTNPRMHNLDGIVEKYERKCVEEYFEKYREIKTKRSRWLI